MYSLIIIIIMNYERSITPQKNVDKGFFSKCNFFHAIKFSENNHNNHVFEQRIMIELCKE